MKVAIVCCFDTFTERQESLRAVFQRRGDSVTVIQSDFSHRTKSLRTDLPEGDCIVHALPYEKNLSAARLRSHIRFAKDVKKALEGEQWDLIWAILAPNSIAQRCAQYCCSHSETKLVIDVNDLWPESLPMGGLKKLPPMAYWRALRDRALPQANAVVTECRLFRDKLGYTDENCTVLYYCKREQTLYPVPCTRADKALNLCYLGSVNNIIDLDAMQMILSALSKCFAVTLHLIADGEKLAELVERSAKAGATVVNHGAVYDPAEKQAILNQCQFGMNIMKPTVCVGLTMKSIDYLEAGLPLLNNIHGDTWDLIQERGMGVNWTEDFATETLHSFDFAAAGAACRRFFEQELTFQRFEEGVERVVEGI